MIYTKEQKSINADILKNAIERTFKKRKYDKSIFDSLKVIENSEVLKARWNSYRNKYYYAKNVEYGETIKCINDLLSVIKKNN